MSSFAIALVDAIRDTLKDDAGIEALVQQKVFDEVPGDQRSEPGAANAKAPWIYVGPIQGPNLENDCVRLWQPTIRIFCASTSFGRRQAWAIGEAVDLVLNNTSLTLAAPFKMTSDLIATNCGDVIGPVLAKTVFLDFKCTIGRDTGDDEEDL